MHCGIELTKYIKWKPDDVCTVKFNDKHVTIKT